MDVVYAAEQAFAQTSGGGGIGSSAIFTQVGFFAAIFAIFYFLLIRPQQKQKREREQMLSAVKRGDRIVTSSGLHGTVTTLSDQTVVLKVSDQVKLEFDRSAIGRIVEVPSQKDA